MASLYFLERIHMNKAIPKATIEVIKNSIGRR